MRRAIFPTEARRLGISWLPSLGFRPPGQVGAEYVRRYGLATGAPRVVRIRKAFNLGNHVRQVANAIRFAELVGAEVVELPTGSIFGTGRVGEIEVVVGGQRARPGTVESTFFYYDRFGLTPEKLARARVIRDLRELFPIEPRDDVATPGLVIHLRAGDVFQANPHPKYGPPPLQFYFESIERGQYPAVQIVTQSLSHPYIAPIREWATDRGIRFSVDSSDLASDFRTLRGAEALCVSQGTLALAAAWLSPFCRTAYTFEREIDEDSVLRELGVHVEAAVGHGFPRSWDASPEQLHTLMGDSGHIEWLGDPSSMGVRGEREEQNE